MQIINNIEVVCSLCGAFMPVETNVGREHDRNMWFFRVMPCQKCQKPKYSYRIHPDQDNEKGEG